MRFKTCYNGIIILSVGYITAVAYAYTIFVFLLPVGIILGLTLTAFRLYKIYRDWRFLVAGVIYIYPRGNRLYSSNLGRFRW